MMTESSHSKKVGMSMGVLAGMALVVGAWLFVPSYLLSPAPDPVEGSRIFYGEIRRPSHLAQMISAHGIRTLVYVRLGERSLQQLAQERGVCDRLNVKVLSLNLPEDGRAGFEQYDAVLKRLSNPELFPVLVDGRKSDLSLGALIAVYRVVIQSRPALSALDELKDGFGLLVVGQRRKEILALRAHLTRYFDSRAPGATRLRPPARPAATGTAD